MFKNKKFVSLILASSLVAVLALGLMAVVPAATVLAAADGEPPDFAENDGFRSGRPGGSGGRDGHRGRGNAYLAEALGITEEDLQAAFDVVRAEVETGDETDRDELLAAALGITIDELDAAQEAAKEAALTQALADGVITEEELALREAREAMRETIEKDEILAQALGISVDDLAAAREDETRLPDLLDELGIDDETFKADMQAAHEELLDQAVADGVLTQEQADLLLETGFDGRRGGHGRGGRGGRPGGEGALDGSERPTRQRPSSSDDNG